ncbi:hypothetical protein ElyMa_002854500 [Elysia marginata]|uniref:Reverse transcriptase domain-containing protein n=1 Tax=Elysia marginata TaxID=1093978 RepID=A0AAV4HV13_9GAST|nr:hypothetical protein ElyMa_002854500 [Elysia marginata]
MIWRISSLELEKSKMLQGEAEELANLVKCLNKTSKAYGIEISAEEINLIKFLNKTSKAYGLEINAEKTNLIEFLNKTSKAYGTEISAGETNLMRNTKMASPLIAELTHIHHQQRHLQILWTHHQ